ncbi:hypothetical protein, partial [Nocardia farcinica]|uniref:hypothetical protein n=1 Tax=Nocardia farcinica TaxID=37329 RepID=UPI002454EA6B
MTGARVFVHMCTTRPGRPRPGLVRAGGGGGGAGGWGAPGGRAHDFAADPARYDIPDSVIGFLRGELGT